MTEVSIVMGTLGRPEATRRTLQSYRKLTHPDYELLFMDVIQNGVGLESVYEEFKDKLPIRRIPMELNMKVHTPGTTWTPATTWNYGIRESTGKFIITCSADILLSYPDMIERFLSQYTSNRISVLTYFMSQDMVSKLDSLDWLGNPDSIQALPGFWNATVNGGSNIDRLSGGLTTFITGQPRERWDYMGLFREELSHLVNDQDMYLRDTFLGHGIETLEGYVGYHQYHPGGDMACVSPGWNYHSEAQARLLEPAPRDAS